MMDSYSTNKSNYFPNANIDPREFGHFLDMDPHAQTITNQNESNIKELALAFKRFQRGVKNELKTKRKPKRSHNATELLNVSQTALSIFTKRPYVETSDDFKTFEIQLMSRAFYDQVLDELLRFRGTSLQASLSNMMHVLMTKEMIKTFCYTGSYRSYNEIPIKNKKEAFKDTRCYDLLNSALFKCYDSSEATLATIKEKLKNIFRNAR